MLPCVFQLCHTESQAHPTAPDGCGCVLTPLVATDGKFVSPLNSYVEILAPKAMVSGGCVRGSEYVTEV